MKVTSQEGNVADTSLTQRPRLTSPVTGHLAVTQPVIRHMGTHCPLHDTPAGAVPPKSSHQTGAEGGGPRSQDETEDPPPGGRLRAQDNNVHSTLKNIQRHPTLKRAWPRMPTRTTRPPSGGREQRECARQRSEGGTAPGSASRPWWSVGVSREREGSLAGGKPRGSLWFTDTCSQHSPRRLRNKVPDRARHHCYEQEVLST